MYAVAAVLLLAVVFVPLPSLTLKGKGAVRGVMAPAERGFSSVWKRLADAGAAIRGMGGAAEKNRDLSLELVRVQAELSQLCDAEADNERLRRAFEFSRQKSYTMIPCNVVSRNISGWWSTVRLGKGTRDGIEENRPVISPDGLVGKVAEATPLTAEVLLVSDPACRVSAKISRSNTFGLVRGAGANLKGLPMARMEFIDKDKEVRVGDEVVTSGLSSAGGGFPKGVHIGYVDKVHRDDSGLYQYAEIIPRATVGLLDYVFVVAAHGPEGVK
ncbi:Cell shape-determining protein MreC [Pontiella sulfatireligans]|uniref:Cell shape-determining protein MreC n=1 Tax=Pontiella sulfatireligans TaxID=2750658 RepID=A0A6C2UP65_9BACT|nr:Cell shape-determining protein MreC [Pontiella sulfatireligans]